MMGVRGGRMTDDRKHRYETILQVTTHNTGRPDGPNTQPPGIRGPSLTDIATRACREASASEIVGTIRAARENGDLIAYPGRDAYRRYCRGTEDGVKAVVGWENTHEEPRTGLIRDLAAAVDK